VRVKRNVGFAAGANRGAEEARGEVIAFLNDDAVAGPGWVAAAMHLLEDPTVGAVAPRVVLSGRYLEVKLDDEPWFAGGDDRPLGRQLTSVSLGGASVLALLAGTGVHELEEKQVDNPGQGPQQWRWTSGRAPFYVPLVDTGAPLELEINGEIVRPSRVVDLVSSAGSYLRPDGYVGDIGSKTPNDDALDVAEERFALSGAALVTTRRVLDRVGRFAPRYFAYYEDTDWCWRARLMGLRMFYDPVATVRHESGGTSAHLPQKRVRQLAERNRILTLVRNAPFDVAMRETWRKRTGGGDDGVAELVPRILPRALAEREVLRRHWVVRPREVFERWAGVDVPASP
jgi:GT2 family glycosyltransferase